MNEKYGEALTMKKLIDTKRKIEELKKRREEVRDRAFMVRIINDIVKYAKKEGINPDEAIYVCAHNLLDLLTIATFNGEGENECKDSTASST